MIFPYIKHDQLGIFFSNSLVSETTVFTQDLAQDAKVRSKY